MGQRYYRNGPARSLSGPILASDTACTVNDASTFPTSFPYTVIFDQGQATEEVAEVTNAAGNLLTISRGVDSTTAFPHGAGAVVVHGVSARDHREANAHVNATTAVHGVAGALVGTTDSQTLTNKTLTSPILNTPTINTPTISAGTITSSQLKGVTATSTGAANVPLSVAGVAGQTADPFRVNDDGGNPLFRVSAAGRVGINTAPGGAVGLFLKNVAGDLDDLTFRIQLLAGQTGDPLSIVDSVAAVQMRVNTSGHVFTSQVQPVGSSLSIGSSGTVGVGAGAAVLNIGQGAGSLNIGNTAGTGTIQIGTTAGGGGPNVHINQNGAGLVSMPAGGNTLIGGDGIIVADSTPPAPVAARCVWINSLNGFVYRWNGAAWAIGAST